jgi:uncharacterized membrane protein (UPF0136 family)
MTGACALWISVFYALGLALFVLVFLVVRLRRSRRPEAIALVTIGAMLAYLVIIALLTVLASRGCG